MGVEEIVAEVGLWWPAADEDAVRAAGAAWERAAGEMDRAVEVGRAGAEPPRATWTGAAADGFAAAWQRHEAALRDDAAGARALGTALVRYADAVADAKHRVIELAVAVGATIVAGVALAWLTFGTSAAAAAGVSAALVAAAEAIGVELSATAASIAGGAVVGTVFGAGEAALVDAAVTQPLRVEAFGDGGYSGAEVTTAGLAGGVGGGLLGGALGGVARPVARAPTAVDDLGEVDGLISAALDPGRRGSLGPLFRPGVQGSLRPEQVPSARLLESEGASVQARADGSALVRTSPADRGRVTELAGPDAPGTDAVQDAILEAGGRLHRDGGGDLVLDGRAVGLSVDDAGEGLAAAVERARAQGLDVPDSIRFVLDDGLSIHWP